MGSKSRHRCQFGGGIGTSRALYIFRCRRACPYKDFGVAIGCHERSTVLTNLNGLDGMCLGIGRNIIDTRRGSQIPNLDRTGLIRAQYLGLVGMEGDRIDRRLGIKFARWVGTAQIPEDNGPIFRPAVEVPTIPLEAQARDGARVSLQGQYWVVIGRVVDLVQADGGVARRRQELLIGSNFQSIDRGVGVTDGSRADAARCLPEAYLVIKPCGCQYDAHFAWYDGGSVALNTRNRNKSTVGSYRFIQ
mmetsp:Transcript_20215/g.57979  ORF Transcript_20215/g.57979 Transcript_20215/m.57979 type:complete len:247 (-) Transcript_20215:68-808(-)